jgi:CRISPR-associated protein Cmr5
MPSLQQVADQQRAASAWSSVQEVNKKPEKLRKEYHALARSTPALVQTNGLGQALAFLRARAKRDTKTAHWLMYSHISRWIAGRVDFGDKGRDGLLEWVVTQTSQVYRQTTAEVVSYMGWLKRFAEAELPEPEEAE